MPISEKCPHYNSPEECVLYHHYEHLTEEYVQSLQIPEWAELQFPIACDHSSQFMCPYPKSYYYEQEVWWIPKKKIPEKGRYQTPYAKHAVILEEPLAEQFWKKKVASFTLKQRLSQNMELNPIFYVGRYCYGIITPGEPEEKDGNFLYKPHATRFFRFAFEYYKPEGAKLVIRNLKLGNRTAIKHPSGKGLEPKPVIEGEEWETLSLEEWLEAEQDRLVPEIPIEEIAQRPTSIGTLQKHWIAEPPFTEQKSYHYDIRLQWYQKGYKKLADHLRGFTLVRTLDEGRLPEVAYEDKIIAVPKACPRVYWWQDVDGLPTLFVSETYHEPQTFFDFERKQLMVEAELQPVKMKEVFQWNVPILQLPEFTEEIQPKDWLTVKGHIPIGKPGSGAHLPGYFDFVEKQFKYILGCDEPNFKEIFAFGNKMKGRYVFRRVEVAAAKWEAPGKMVKLKGKVHRWLFWRTRDQKRFERLKELLEGKAPKTGEVSWTMPIEKIEDFHWTGEQMLDRFGFQWMIPVQEVMSYPEEQRKGCLIYGEAIHSGRLPSRKEYSPWEVLTAGKVLRKKPIRWSPHHQGKIIGQIWDAEPIQQNGDVLVKYLGFVWDGEAVEQLRKYKEGKVSVGVEFRKPKYYDGLKPMGAFFEDLVLLKPWEKPGDPEATYRVLREMFEID